MTTCIIAEKPSVARDISRIVGATSKQDRYIRCLWECLYHYAQPQPFVDTETGRFLCGVADYLIGSHHLVSENLWERKGLHLSPCHRISQPSLRTDIPDTHFLRWTCQLPFSFYGRMGGWSSGPVTGTDCQCQDTAITHDFTCSLLGDDRRWFLTWHQ